jgi:hypothetical protein
MCSQHSNLITVERERRANQGKKHDSMSCVIEKTVSMWKGHRKKPFGFRPRDSGTREHRMNGFALLSARVEPNVRHCLIIPHFLIVKIRLRPCSPLLRRPFAFPTFGQPFLARQSRSVLARMNRICSLPSFLSSPWQSQPSTFLNGVFHARACLSSFQGRYLLLSSGVGGVGVRLDSCA